MAPMALLYRLLSLRSLKKIKEDYLDRTLSFIEVKTQQCSPSFRLTTTKVSWKRPDFRHPLTVIMEDTGEFLQEAKEWLVK